MHPYLYVFEDVRAVKGFVNTALYDLSEGALHLIPSSYYELFGRFQTERIDDIISSYTDDSDKAAVNDIMEFLIGHKMAMRVADRTQFPALSLDWDYPLEVSNAIVDIGTALYDHRSVITQLLDMNCNYLQLRVFRQMGREELVQLLSNPHLSKFHSVELLLPYHEELSDESVLTALTDRFVFLSNVYLAGAPETRVIQSPQGASYDMGHIYLTTQPVAGCASCGVINRFSFVAPNLNFFTESQQFNTCLNRKISVDEHGNIKNCPSLKESFGHVHGTTLREALTSEGFKRKWHIAKDQIDVCRDCEFRHICSDCRANLSDPANEYSKPATCRYNPYEGVWE